MELKIADIVTESVVDGTGFRFTIFTQGCPHKCEGCHNPTTHDFNGGHVFDTEEIMKMVLRDPLLDGVTYSGGEPFMQPRPLYELSQKLHAKNFNVWCYTGFTLEELKKKAQTDEDIKNLLCGIDVLVDGKFILKKKNLLLKFRGSSNQRIIDMNKTRESGSIVLKE